MGKNRKMRGSVMSQFTMLDMLGDSIGFNIGGRYKYGTCMGALLSLVVIVLTLVYAAVLVRVMVTYEDTHFLTRVEKLEEG